MLVAGCASTPTDSDEVISAPPVTAQDVSSLNWNVPNAIQPFPGPRGLQPPARFRPSPPVTTWTSLNRWAAENQLGELRQLSRAPVAAYALRTSAGTLVLDIGSREATWNGVEFNLGFAPQFIDDQVFVHGIDILKNLEPLLFGPPLAFGNRVIVIDPGHGGANVGTRSVLDGRYEKEFTLDWALRLAPLLEANGWQVFLTRTSDVTVSNFDRVVFAEQHRADLFISLHFNSTPDRDRNPGGLMTFCITPTGMPSTLTRGFSDNWLEALPNNNFDAQNLQLAVRLQHAILRATGLEDRGVCYSRFETVLRGQNRPAVLIEGGFLSNPREAKLIATPEFRQKLAQAVAEALK